MESKVNATPHPNLDSLKGMITEIWDAYPTGQIMDACHRFCCCVEAVIAAEGSFIENQTFNAVTHLV